MSDDTCQAQLTLFPKAQAKLLLQGAEDLDLRQQHRTAASGLQIEGTAVHVAGMRRGTAVDRCLMRKIFVRHAEAAPGKDSTGHRGRQEVYRDISSPCRASRHRGQPGRRWGRPARSKEMSVSCSGRGIRAEDGGELRPVAAWCTWARSFPSCPATMLCTSLSTWALS